MGFVKVKLLSPVVVKDPLDNRVRRDISMHQMRLANAIRTSNPFVTPSLHEMGFALTSGGIRIRKRRKGAQTGKSKGSPEELASDLQALIKQEWLPFCEHVLEDIITFGFAIIALDVNRKVPYVRNPVDSFQRISISTDKHGMDRLYELTMREDNPGFAANFLTTASGESSTTNVERTAPPMFVLECWPPGADGDLNSPCRTLIPLDSFMQTIMQCQISVAQRNARPVLITSTEKMPVDQKNVARDISAAGDSAIVHREQNALAHRIHFEATGANLESIRALNERFAQGHLDANQRRLAQLGGGSAWMQLMNTNTLSNGMTLLNNAPLAINPVTGTAQYPALVGTAQYEGSVIPLPPNTSLEATPEAKGSESFIAKMWEIFRDITMMTLGVPPVLWGSTASSVAGNLVVINTYNDTKLHYQVILQDLIQFCFVALFGENEMRVEMKRITVEKLKKYRQKTKDKVKDKLEHGPEHEDQDAEEEDVEVHIDVAFPGVLDMEQIMAVNELGLLTHEAKRKYVSAYLGIPEDDLANEPMDPLSGRPMKEVTQEQYEREDTVMQTQAKLNMSVKGPPKSGVGKRPAQKKPRTMGTRN